MATYNTSDFRKGLKVQIDGDPYLMIECNFVKPGKGQALYKCKLRNLIRNTVLDRTYKSGDSLEAADIEEIDGQYLYRQGDTFVFMDNENYEQYELSKEQVDDAWKYLKEGMDLQMLLFNNNPIRSRRPTTSCSKIDYCEPAVQGQHGHQRHQAGARWRPAPRFICPAFVEIGDLIKIDTRTGEYVERARAKARTVGGLPDVAVPGDRHGTVPCDRGRDRVTRPRARRLSAHGRLAELAAAAGRAAGAARGRSSTTRISGSRNAAALGRHRSSTAISIRSRSRCPTIRASPSVAASCGCKPRPSSP